jgi:hypothetical protein
VRLITLLFLAGCITNEPHTREDQTVEIRVGAPDCTMSRPSVRCRSREQCDDGSTCTAEACVNGICEYLRTPDGLPCSTGEREGTCHEGGCCADEEER